MSGISFQKSVSTAVQQEPLLSTMLGRNYSEVLDELSARALTQNVPAREYWEQNFSFPTASNSKHLKTIEKVLRPSAFVISSAIPEQTVLIDLACGPTSVIENFFKDYLHPRVSAWVGVDIVNSALADQSNKNRVSQFSHRIQADLLDFLKVLSPDAPQYSFYMGSWPSLSGHYEAAALGYIQLLMKPGSLVFCNCEHLIPFFAAQSQDFRLLCGSGVGASRIAIFQRVQVPSPGLEPADAGRLVLPHIDRTGPQ